MAKVLPFKGLRYNLEKAGPMDTLVAPPYDVVDKDTRDKIVSQNPYNIFSLELPDPNDNPGTGTPNKYEYAKQLLKKWLEEQIFLMEETPSIYPYHTEFTVNNTKFCRKGFIALINIEEWEKSIILPHEQTFNKVTKDRLKLLEATKAQFSQIFLFYRGNEEAKRLLSAGNSEELCSVDDAQGNIHRFFRLSDEEQLRAISKAFADSALYIADGHHRYTTALEYKNLMREKYGDDPTMPYNYCMAYLVDATDPGLVVLPTHRILTMQPTANPEDVIESASRLFTVEEVQGASGMTAEKMSAILQEKLSSRPSDSGIGVLFGNRKNPQIWWLKEDIREKLLGHLPPQISRLDVVMLEEVVMKELLSVDLHQMETDMSLRYTADGVDAIKGLQAGEMLFFMRPTPVSQVLDVADAGLTMPHKSTYFYPKILTGLVINSLDRNNPVSVL